MTESSRRGGAVRQLLIRFRTADDLELDTTATVVRSTPMEKWIAIAREARRR